MGHKISKEQIDPGVKDHIMSFVGNVADLETEVNTDIISAVNSLIADRVDNVENIGKLAEAIGEPVTANHSIDEVVEGLGEMLSTFKTNMMNNGITVESNDKFKALIDKIATLADNEGRGIHYADGAIGISYDSGEYGYGDIYNQVITTNLDFTPTIIFVQMQDNNVGSNSEGSMKSYMYISNLTTYDEEFVGYTDHLVIKITDISAESFNINITAAKNAYGVFTHWYAIGVGEEDTTLRDSLASILTEEGVSVTEEDDMASLIGKVDSEFDNKNAELENGAKFAEGTYTVPDSITYLSDSLSIDYNLNFTPTHVIVCITALSDGGSYYPIYNLWLSNKGDTTIPTVQSDDNFSFKLTNVSKTSFTITNNSQVELTFLERTIKWYAIG